jgi:hypothetical protein
MITDDPVHQFSHRLKAIKKQAIPEIVNILFAYDFGLLGNDTEVQIEKLFQSN